MMAEDPSAKVRQRLLKFCDHPKKVHIVSSFPGDAIANGFILGVGSSLVLLHRFNDFFPTGYTILRIGDVLSVRHSAHEQFWERMFKGEGILDRVGISFEVPLDDFRSALRCLMKRKLHVIIESEKPNPGEDDFFIGRITSLRKTSVSALYFDPLGRWSKDPDSIRYDAITRVEFDSPYINTISKYLS